MSRYLLSSQLKENTLENKVQKKYRSLSSTPLNLPSITMNENHNNINPYLNDIQNNLDEVGSIISTITEDSNKKNNRELKAINFQNNIKTSLSRLDDIRAGLEESSAELAKTAPDWYNSNAADSIKEKIAGIDKIKTVLQQQSDDLVEEINFDKKNGVEKFLKYLGDSLNYGIGSFDKGLMSTLDFIIPDEYINYGDNIFSRTFKTYYDLYDNNKKQIDKTVSYLGGGGWELGSEFISGLVSALPTIALAAASGGSSMAASGIGAAAAEAGTSAMIANSAAQMAKNPAFWTNAIPAFGNTYSDAKEAGANELKATTAALLDAFTGVLFKSVPVWASLPQVLNLCWVPSKPQEKKAGRIYFRESFKIR